MNAKRAALLRDVVQAIIDSGYAELPCQPEAKRPHVDRRAQIEVLSLDPRIVHRPNGKGIGFVTYVSATYNVSRGNARTMLYRARKQRRAAQAQKTGGR